MATARRCAAPASTGAVALGHLLGKLRCLPARGERELVRQIVLAQGDLDLHARIGVAAEHFDDARDRFALGRGLLDDLGDNDVACLRAAALVPRHQQILIDSPVLGDDEADPALLVQPPDDGAVRALENVDDLAFRATAPVGAGAAHRRTVAVQHLVHLARSEEDIGAAVVGNEKAEAVGVSLHGAGDEVELRDDAELALAVHQQLAVALHRIDAVEECVACAPVDCHGPRELGRRQRNTGLLERVEYRFARREQRRVDAAAAARFTLARECGAERPAALRCARDAMH